MGPPQIDEFDDSVQDRSESGRRCLLKDCECPFRAAARSAAVLFTRVCGSQSSMGVMAEPAGLSSDEEWQSEESRTERSLSTRWNISTR